MHIRQTQGAVKTMHNIPPPPPFQKQHFCRSPHASTRLKESTICSAKLPNITSASCDLDLRPPDPRCRPFMPSPRGNMIICIEIGSVCSKYSVHKLVTDKFGLKVQTNQSIYLTLRHFNWHCENTIYHNNYKWHIFTLFHKVANISIPANSVLYKHFVFSGSNSTNHTVNKSRRIEHDTQSSKLTVKTAAVVHTE